MLSARDAKQTTLRAIDKQAQVRKGMLIVEGTVKEACEAGTYECSVTITVPVARDGLADLLRAKGYFVEVRGDNLNISWQNA